jgi:hypothetical protein
MSVLWAQGSRGSILCSQLMFTLGFYTVPHRNRGSIPSVGSVTSPVPCTLSLSDLGSSLRPPLWSAMFPLDVCQESERFSAVLRPPHLVWSDNISTIRLSTMKLMLSFWFLVSCSVYCIFYTPSSQKRTVIEVWCGLGSLERRCVCIGLWHILSINSIGSLPLLDDLPDTRTLAS